MSELEQRLAYAGLLPGEMAWRSDLYSYVDEFLAEWIDEFVEETAADRIVNDAGIAQTRRLLPNTSERDRRMLQIGLVVHQIWLYTYVISETNYTHEGTMPPYYEELLARTENYTMSLCTLIEQLKVDNDMSSFEEKL